MDRWHAAPTRTVEGRIQNCMSKGLAGAGQVEVRLGEVLRRSRRANERRPCWRRGFFRAAARPLEFGAASVTRLAGDARSAREMIVV